MERKQEHNHYIDVIKKLEKEKEELHIKYAGCKTANNAIREENEKLKKQLELDEVQLNYYFIGEEKICKQIETYQNVLGEIRDIAQDIIENDVYENSDTKAQRILNRINEVLNNGN